MPPIRATRRAARLLAPMAASVALLLLSAGAQASPRGPHGAAAKSGCPAAKTVHRARRAASGSCRRHAHRHATRRPAKRSAKHPPAPAVELVPAACEDGSLPSHSGGGEYSCEDGSAPSCEEGAPRTAAAGPPKCAVQPSPETGCDREAATCGSSTDFACEDPSGEAASANCEPAEEVEIVEEE
ncbi:MAG TPA: hypothetical protein VN618_06290 [Solirubrobacteraceae bacterium]|nr:hypothetical protein [Solirubrobacteraceae bacterium]